MKISVTFEKKDILRLVEKDLKAQGLKLKNGTSLEYKGALEVKLSVETEDDALVAAHPTTTTTTAPKPTVTAETTPAVTVDEPDMSSVLAASNRLVKNDATGKVRALGPNESLDFPKDY